MYWNGTILAFKRCSAFNWQQWNLLDFVICFKQRFFVDFWFDIAPKKIYCWLILVLIYYIYYNKIPFSCTYNEKNISLNDLLYKSCTSFFIYVCTYIMHPTLALFIRFIEWVYQCQQMTFIIYFYNECFILFNIIMSEDSSFFA